MNLALKILTEETPKEFFKRRGMGIKLNSIQKPMEFARVPVGKAFSGANGKCYVKKRMPWGVIAGLSPGTRFGRDFNESEYVFPSNWNDEQILAWLSDSSYRRE